MYVEHSAMFSAQLCSEVGDTIIEWGHWWCVAWLVSLAVHWHDAFLLVSGLIVQQMTT
jgi:hypothetical protein